MKKSVLKNGVYWIRFKRDFEIDIDYNETLDFQNGEKTIVTKTNDGFYLGYEGLKLELERDDFVIISTNLEEHIDDEIQHNRELVIWINEDDTYEYDGENLKPSEIITMGCILQRDGLCEFELNERVWNKADENKEDE